MPLNITSDIERQIREFEDRLTQSREASTSLGRQYYDQWVGSGAPYRSITDAVTNRLFDLLGPSQASSTFRGRFTGNPFALQSGYTAEQYAKGLESPITRGAGLPFKYGVTDFLKDLVPTGSAYIQPKRARDIFSSLPQDLLGRTTTNEAAYQLTQMSPGELYDLYSAQYSPTGSIFEQRRRGNEQTDVLRQLESVEGGDVGELRYFQGLSTGVNFSKYNQTVSEPYKNMGANFVQTVTANDPTYLQAVEMALPGATNALKNMTVGQVLRMQADYWQSPEGQRDPDQAKALQFVQQYGYWPSSIEAKAGKSGIGAGTWGPPPSPDDEIPPPGPGGGPGGDWSIDPNDWITKLPKARLF